MAVSIQKQRSNRDSMELVEKPENSIQKHSVEWLKPYQFQPGKSGNPGGRPKKHLTEALLDALEKDPKRAAKIANKLLAQAENGDVQSFDRIADRTEGPVPKTNIHTGDIDVNVSAKRTRLAEVLALLGDAS